VFFLCGKQCICMWNCNATVKICLLAVGWRPAFKFYSMWLSLVGAVVCIFVMFIISWPTALITMAVIAVLFFYVHYRKPGLSLPLPVFAQVLFSPVFVCYSAPDRGVEYCDERICVCLCVCLSIFASDLHQIFCACYPWPWLSPALAA